MGAGAAGVEGSAEVVTGLMLGSMTTWMGIVAMVLVGAGGDEDVDDEEEDEGMRRGVVMEMGISVEDGEAEGVVFGGVGIAIVGTAVSLDEGVLTIGAALIIGPWFTDTGVVTEVEVDVELSIGVELEEDWTVATIPFPEAELEGAL